MAGVNPEASLAHRRVFAEFLDPDNRDGAPMRRLLEMLDEGKRRFVVDLTDLRNFDSQLARRLIRAPAEYLPALQRAAEDAVRRADPKYLQGEGEMVAGARAADAQCPINVAISGPMGFHSLTPRELLSPFLNTLVCVRGIVTKCSSVRPKVVKSVHFCPATGMFSSREYRDVTALTGAPTPAVYPTKDEKGNVLVTEYGLSRYVDHQMLAIQEMPENSPPGQLPRSIDVIVEDDLVDACKPGDRVAIYGLYKAAPSTRVQGSMSGAFRTVLVANNVQQLNKEVEGPKYRPADIRAIKQVAARKDAWDVLGESMAPSIYGHGWIKKGLVLLLLGGAEKNLDNGTHIRGDLNMMMVGDPSVAKSQLLRAVMTVAPLAISTNGRGSSGVGLTAAVTTDQDTGERRLEAGAMVLADRGIVCVDEFDKMNDMDRVAIHEVMEQQTVTIAKAGIHASLNARCSVLAAANPIYGSYDHSLTPTRNIALPDSLLSRFDLLFIVVDHMDADVDRSIAEHVLRMHRYRAPGDDGTAPTSDAAAPRYDEDEDDQEADSAVYQKFDPLLHGERKGSARGRRGGGEQRLLTRKFLKKFIHYARGRTPRLSDEAATEKIAQTYAEMRAQGMDPSRKAETGGTLPVTARSLETIIRLSTAHAKLKLQQQVKVSDVEAALRLLDFALYHRELDEVDKRLEEVREEKKREERERRKQEQAEQRRKEAEDSGQEAGGGGEARGDGEDDRSKRPRAEEGDVGGAGAGKAAQGDAGAAEERDAEAEGAPAAQDVTAAADDDSVEVTLERRQLFQQTFSEHAMAARVESLPIQVLIDAINRRLPSALFTRPEVEAILAEMEENNRVMYTRGVVHLI